MTREERRAALDCVRSDNDGDVWGTCMMHWFGVANALYVHGAHIPAEWEYRPGWLVNESDITDWPESYYHEELALGRMTTAQLVYTGNVLMRWSRLLRHAGRDY